jgi:predicted transcriptional regulator of viral defense system
MDYIALCACLKNNRLLLFTLEDIKNLFPDEKEKTIKNSLTRWVAKKYFSRLRQGLYEFVGQARPAEIPDLYIANRLYEPSYVSLETALSIYSIIPDVAAGVTSITVRATRLFKNKYGSFFYRTCRRRAFTGYRIMSYDGFKVNIADKEKALTDFLYYRLRSGYSLNFSEERLNKKILKKIDWKKVSRYAGLFNEKTVSAAKMCEGYVKC